MSSLSHRPSVVVLPVLLPAPGAPPLEADLAAAGFDPLPRIDGDMLVRDALRRGAQAVVCWDAAPQSALLAALETLHATAPLPVVMFTHDASVESMRRGLSAGVHAWVVNGYTRERLRAVVQLALERFRVERGLRERLDELGRRFEERKLIERAKGVLMRAAQVSEDEAFALLRGASMRGQQRVGALSQQVIDAARHGEAINRAGQLRMLSQRIVKFAALVAIGNEATDAQQRLAHCVERAEHNLAALARSLSQPTYGDLVEALQAAWRELRAAPQGNGSVLAALDTRAEHALECADRLVRALEAGDAIGGLHVINLCGRQRMLSQRIAKQALLGVADDGSVAAFETALQALREQPLTTREIADALERVGQQWRDMLGAAARTDDADRRELAASSEALLETLERLTESYERSVGRIIGAR